jgi:hypothetical protein
MRGLWFAMLVALGSACGGDSGDDPSAFSAVVDTRGTVVDTTGATVETTAVVTTTTEAAPVVGVFADSTPPAEGVAAPRPEQVGEVSLNETSALTASRSEPNVYWTIRDRHDEQDRTSLLGMRVVDGEIDENYGDDGLREVDVVGATNTDWETVASGPEGTLFIGDTGNNSCKRDDQYVIQVAEPQPGDDEVEVVATFPVSFPDTGATCGGKDVEAMFFANGALHLVSKTTPPALYRLDGPQDGAVNELVRLGAIGQPAGGFTKLTTGAAVNDAGTRVVVTTASERFWVYEIAPGSDAPTALVETAPVWSRQYLEGGADLQVEGAAFVPGTDDLMFVSENKTVWRWSAEQYEAGRF